MTTETFDANRCGICGAPAQAGCEHSKKGSTEATKIEEPASRIDSPKDEYGTMEDLFLIEHLDENFDKVVSQLEDLRKLIADYNESNARHNEDEGMEMYLDEDIMDLEDAYKNFEINGKVLDIRKLIPESMEAYTNEEKYNAIAMEVNGYIANYMIGKNKKLISQI